MSGHRHWLLSHASWMAIEDYWAMAKAYPGGWAARQVHDLMLVDRYRTDFGCFGWALHG